MFRNSNGMKRHAIVIAIGKMNSLTQIPEFDRLEYVALVFPILGKQQKTRKYAD